MYINREKDRRRELERVQKYADPETLSTHKMAVQMRDTMKEKKKVLQKEYEELKGADSSA